MIFVFINRNSFYKARTKLQMTDGTYMSPLNRVGGVGSVGGWVAWVAWVGGWRGSNFGVGS